SSGVHAEVVRGCQDPVQGWYSAQYGDMKPSSVLRITVNDTVPCAAITLLIPTSSDADPGDRDNEPTMHEQEMKGSAGVACTLEHRGMRDLFVIALQDNP